MSKNKWSWAKEVKSAQDVRPKHVADAYCLNLKACSKGKHRPCKNNPRCVESIVEKHWSAEEPPRSKTDTKLKGKIPYAGLKNAGALCYCNVFLQLWFHNAHFRDAIYRWHPVTNGEVDPEEFSKGAMYLPEATSILGQLQLIIAEMEFGNSNIVDPIKLAEALNLNQNTHQDPQEFATLFLNCRKYIVDNITQELFMTEYNSVIKCSECGQANTTSNSMLNFQLPLTSKKQTVSEIVQATMDGEKLDGENQYFCTRCAKKCDAIKKLEFTKLPPTFVIQVLRSEYNREKNRITKLKTFLEIPNDLDLSSFVASDANNTHKMFNLSAVVVHLGTEVSGGHYIVNIRDAKSGKWFSFNDTNIENMNKDCLVEGAKTSKVSKVNPDALLSNIAYMLVYDSVDQKEVVPCLPPWLDDCINSKNKELEIEEGQIQSEELLRTSQWESNKEYMMDMMEGLSAEEDGSGEFIPLKWMSGWAENPQTESHINNEDFLCPHKKVAFSKVCNMRLIGSQAAEKLFSTYKGGPRLSVPQGLCHECIAVHCSLLQLQERLEKDAKAVAQEMKIQRKVSAPSGFWVSKSSFARWKSLAKAKIEIQLAESEDQGEEAEKESQDEEEEGEKSDEEEVPCKSRKLSDENEKEEEKQGEEDAKKNGHDEVKDFVFNSDLLCTHGGLSTNENLRRLVPEEVWKKLKAYFVNALEFSHDCDLCQVCQEHDMENSVEQAKLVELAQKIKEQLPDLIAFPNTKNPNNKHVAFETHSNRPELLYVISFDFVLELNKFVKNPTKVAQPREVVNAGLVCAHQLVHVDLGMNGSFDVMDNDKSFWVLVEPQDWYFIIKNFNFDYQILLHTSTSAADIDFVEPEICTGCLVHRKKTFEYSYSNCYLNIRRVEFDAPKKECGDAGLPRSRRRRQKDDFEIKVDALDTIRSVKSQIMKKLANGCCFSDLHLFTQDGGRDLSDLNSTLQDYEIRPNAVLLLKVGISFIFERLKL